MSARILAFKSPDLAEHQLQALVARNLRRKRPRPLDTMGTLMLVEDVVHRLANPDRPDRLTPTSCLILQAALGYLALARKVSQLSEPEGVA